MSASKLSDPGGARSPTVVLGSNITRLRRAMYPPVSQEALAYTADISRGVLSRIENGTANPTVRTVARIAHALGCHLADLFADPPDPHVAQSAPAGPTTRAP